MHYGVICNLHIQLIYQLYYMFTSVFTEWCQAICRFLKDQLSKVTEHYHGSSTNTSFLTAGLPNLIDIEQVMKYWNYSSLLARNLYLVIS